MGIYFRKGFESNDSQFRFNTYIENRLRLKILCPYHLFLGEWSDDQHNGGGIEPDKERQWGSY